MLDQALTTQWERNVEWYEKTANRPIEWGDLKNNDRMQNTNSLKKEK
jgi:hypothetical protein